MSTILIAGGAGFIGSHLADSLIKHGDNVIVLDDLSTGRYANIQHLEDATAFNFWEWDVTKPLPDLPKVDQIYHLASNASPKDFHTRAMSILQSGSVGTLNLLDFAANQNARMLFASSSEVYGHSTNLPYRETDPGLVNPVGPRSPYDESKRFGEAACIAAARHELCEIRIARIFNTYGTRMRLDDGRVIPSFLRALIEGNPMPIFGDGTQTRAFCHVTDMVAGLRGLMGSELGTPCNLGNPVETSIMDLGQLMSELFPVSRGYDFHEALGEDPIRRCPSIELAQETFHWAPSISLQDGLREMVTYYRPS
jgi:nucleoside-diphosphate-sugar epimerase